MKSFSVLFFCSLRFFKVFLLLDEGVASEKPASVFKRPVPVFMDSGKMSWVFLEKKEYVYSKRTLNLFFCGKLSWILFPICWLIHLAKPLDDLQLLQPIMPYIVFFFFNWFKHLERAVKKTKTTKERNDQSNASILDDSKTCQGSLSQRVIFF